MQAIHTSPHTANTYPVMGTQTTFLLTGAETNNAFSLYRITACPGSIVPTHTHLNEAESFLVRAGQLRIIVDGQTIIANPGDVAYGPKGIPHSWESVGTGDAIFDVLTTPAAMETMFLELSRLTQGAPIGDVLEICARSEIHFAPMSA